MSDMYRLREIAALLQPKRVAEAKIPQGFEGIKRIVEDALGDLEDKLGEGGALESMLDSHGLSEMAEASIDSVVAAMKVFKKEVESFLLEAEMMIHTVSESLDPEPEELDEALTDEEKRELKKLNGRIVRWQDTYGPGGRAESALGKEWRDTVKQIEALEKKREKKREKKLDEMASARKYDGGAFNRKQAKLMIRAFKEDGETFDLEDGSKYEFDKPTNGGALKKGDVVFAVHDKYNTGAELYEILGFGNGNKVEFDTVKDALKARGVTSLKALEKFNTENEDKEVRLLVKDLESGESGDWFYLFEGRWAYGSGAEPLSFSLVKKVS